MPLPCKGRRFRYLCFLIGLFALCLILAASSSTQLQAQDIVTVNPLPITTYLTNPGIGWHQKNLHLPQMLPETTDYISRSSIGWDVLNPLDDVYQWDVLDNAIAAAVAQGKQAAFRVYTMGPPPNHRVPEWVLTKGAVITPHTFPDYNNCTYQQEWSEFVEAMRLHYDGHPSVVYIDISGYGTYNEWNWVAQDNRTKWESDYNNPATLDGHARRRLADIFIGGTQVSSRCIDNLDVEHTVSYSYVGFQQTQLLMPYAGIRQSTWYVQERRADVGFRHDCLGSPGHDTWADLGTTLELIWRNAPIVYEFCSDVTTDEPYASLTDTLLRQSHATMVGDNMNVNGSRDPAVVEAYMLRVGYRYQLLSVSHPDTVAIGQDFTVNMNWWNIGYAPAYLKMGHDFTAYFYLVDAGGQTVAAFPLQSAVESWMPANDVTTTSTENPPDNLTSDTWTMPVLPVGVYSTYVGVIHNPSGNHINLAIEGRDTVGRYPLHQITIHDGTPVPSNTPTDVPTDDIASTSTATDTATLTSTSTATNTPTETATDIPTDTATIPSTATQTATDTATLTLTSTPTNTPSETATDIPSHTPTSTSTDTETFTPTSTPTETATDTPTATETATTTSTSTATNTPTATETATTTSTSTATNTPTDIPTDTPSHTPTDIPTSTLTDVPTETATNTVTHTPTETTTYTPTAAPTETATSTPTETPTDTPSHTPTDIPTSTLTDVPTETTTYTPTAAPTETATSTTTDVATDAATAIDEEEDTVTDIPSETMTSEPIPTDSLSDLPDDSVPDETDDGDNQTMTVDNTPLLADQLHTIIQLTGSHEIVQIGETVTFTITVTNPATTGLENVTITNALPHQFETLAVTTTEGTALVTANRVSVNVGLLQPQQTITVVITTRSIGAGFPPDTCTSAAVAGVVSNQVCTHIFPNVLPQTGQSPLTLLRALLICLTVVSTIGFSLSFTIRRIRSNGSTWGKE